MLPTIATGNVASALPTGYDVANSGRFNSADSPKLGKTFGSASNSRTTFTVSAWVKRSKLGANQDVVSAFQSSSGLQTDLIRFGSGDDLEFWAHTTNSSGNADIQTNRLFRDVGAWYHIVVRVDTTQGTDTNRVRIYVNGVQETSFSTSNYMNQNGETVWGIGSGVEHTIGAVGTSNYFGGYVAEVVYLDGQSVAPTEFGEFDEDSPTIWKPKDVSGLTFGNNSFYLDFKTSAELGDDVSGNTNDFTETNLASTDQSTDTPTNNFATLNPLDNYYAASTFSEGNCKIVTHSGNMSYNTGTIAVSTGKWYVEAKVIDNADSNYHHLGITETPTTATSNWIGLSATHYGLTGYDGKIWRNNSGTAYGVSTTTGDIVGMYIDLDNNKLYFAKNGTLMNSGTGHSITAAASTANGYYLIAYGDWENLSTATWEVNFGNPTYTGTDQADANGYGSFEYSPSAGTFDSASKDFLALCTKNLGAYGG